MRRTSKGATAALAALVLLLAGTGARRGEVRATSIAIQPLMDPAPSVPVTDPLRDGGPLVAQFILSVTSGIDVKWRPVDPGGATVLSLAPPGQIPARSELEPDPDHPHSPLPAIRVARQMLETLPRAWRRRSLKRMVALRLAFLDEGRAGLLVDALAARAAGEPLRAAELLGDAVAGEESELPPVVHYLHGVALAEAEELTRAAGAIAAAGDSLTKLPGPMVSMGRAILDAAGGRRNRAMGRLTSVSESQPSLSEAMLLRARLSRAWCDLYDQRRIIEDLDSVLLNYPCSPSGSLNLAEMLAFTDRPDTASTRIRSDAGCTGVAGGSSRARALALAFAAEGVRDRALESAAVAESRDVSALRRGLAPAFMLSGDFAHLDEVYDPEADLTLEGDVAVEHQFYSGLNALWTGRPSRAAEHFERAEALEMGRLGDEADAFSRLQLVRILRIRSYLAAGRVEEARQASGEARQAGRGNLNGLLIYSTGMADLAAGELDQALIMTRRLTLAGLKFWRYLLDAELALGEDDGQKAQAALSLASQGIGTQTTVCPGVSVEPYMLQAQGRALLALGRNDAAERLLKRLVESGSRGLMAPDVLVPAWGLLARARELGGDPDGALEAWEGLLERWGAGEATPALEEARRERDRLRGLLSPLAVPGA